jgi:hypothetical protein
MSYQLASRPQTSKANHESSSSSSLTSIRLLELALEEEQDFSLELPIVPQNSQSRYSSNARQNDPSLVSSSSIQLQELALEEEEQEFGLKLPVFPRTPQSRYSSSASNKETLPVSLTLIQFQELALEEQEFSLEFPVVPQTIQPNCSSYPNHEPPLPVPLTSIQFQELALQEEQEFSLQFPVAPQTTQRSIPILSIDANSTPNSLLCPDPNKPIELALLSLYDRARLKARVADQ